MSSNELHHYIYLHKLGQNYFPPKIFYDNSLTQPIQSSQLFKIFCTNKKTEFGKKLQMGIKSIMQIQRPKVDVQVLYKLHFIWSLININYNKSCPWSILDERLLSTSLSSDLASCRGLLSPWPLPLCRNSNSLSSFIIDNSDFSEKKMPQKLNEVG